MATIKSKARDRPRHSANFTQGTAKKGGAGGRGTWGSPQQDYKFMDEDMHALDPNDPNFDEETDGSNRIEWASFEPRERAFSEAVLSAGKFKRAMHEAMHSFLVSHEPEEVISVLGELNQLSLHHEVVKIAISVAMDAGESDRKAVSALLKHLASKSLLTLQQIVFGFRRLYNRLPDLVLDVPNARTLLNGFGRRAALAGILDTDTAGAFRVAAEAYEDPASLADVKARFESILDEYLSHEDLDEFASSLREINKPHLHRELVKLALLRGLDRDNRQRELVSRLLALDDVLITREDVESGFEVLLDRVDDLHRDCPNVLRLLSSFLARAVSDEAVSPAFVSRSQSALEVEDHHGGRPASTAAASPDEFYRGDVLRSASALLAMPHAGARISGIWGPSSCDELKIAVAALAAEYLDTGDADEALRCLKELDAPMFWHEMVKRVFVLGCDGRERERQLAEALVHRLAQQEGMLTQVRKGVDRIKADLEEVVKDAPHASDALASLEERLRGASLLHDAVPLKAAQ